MIFERSQEPSFKPRIDGDAVYTEHDFVYNSRNKTDDLATIIANAKKAVVSAGGFHRFAAGSVRLHINGRGLYSLAADTTPNDVDEEDRVEAFRAQLSRQLAHLTIDQLHSVEAHIASLRK